ncbi:aminotransferase [Fusarium oxysporum f. sp. albedinis]|nr:aminotransferase [Fusarium oxysporum f. sp. albedinis]KAJ0129782.1 hypothetical protein HZ326_27113 [Fusarium oxysporum f. sp. albedinis]KAJ0134879.1 hypothetical protein HZ326_22084 [Fusarium oxysporum f. sp. albedinis]KAK2469935.1 hypothetical protein H9L39_18750 [Fusarium oxysporum f. sp. albedinis]
MGSLENSQQATAESQAPEIKISLSDDLVDVPELGSPEYLALANTDHMVTIKWTSRGGWETPELRPVSNLPLPPTASCLHYATECFEGLKAYRGYDGALRLFRPDCNGERLAMSAQRASLPPYPPDQLKYLIAKLMEIDGHRWLPKDRPGHYVYIRPAIIGIGKKLGFKIPDEALLFIIATPYADLNKTRDGKPLTLKLLTSPPDAIRAWPGGYGYAKLGANYGPSLEAHSHATAAGFNQILWLFGKDRIVTEAGASNLFLVIRNQESGRNELVTPSLDNSLILSGITRRSVLELARERLINAVGGLKLADVKERQVTIRDIEQAWRDGHLLEAFVVGTAYSLTSVSLIRNGTDDIEIGDAGYASQINAWLDEIRYGKTKHDWTYKVKE